MEIPAISMRVPGLTTPNLGEAAPAPSTQAPATTPDAGTSTSSGGFGQALSTAIEGLSQSQNAADDASVRMAAGEPIDLHEVMLARETASLQFQLAVQVRNKLVEAYQDVMRMQV
jgi:flagellar hook-basal body complex protein FliE